MIVFNMLSRIEKLRKKLHENIEAFGVNSEEAIKVSKKLDALINEYYDREIKYTDDNIIKITFDLSYKELQNLSLTSDKFPSTKEWNQYAKEKNLLSSTALEYVSGLDWHKLRNKIMNKKN